MNEDSNMVRVVINLLQKPLTDQSLNIQLIPVLKLIWIGITELLKNQNENIKELNMHTNLLPV